MLAETENDPAVLWAEIHRLRAKIEGPFPYSTWEQCALDQRLKLIAIQQASRTVINRWDGPNWKDLGPTAKVMDKLRSLLPPVKPSEGQS